MALIALSRALVALVDEEDIDLVSVHRWHAKPCQRPAGAHYACAAVNGTTVYLHRYLMGATKGQFVDHINGDRLDARGGLATLTAQRKQPQRAMRLQSKLSDRSPC